MIWVTPAHNAKSFEDMRMLKFMLHKVQYAFGDLTCEG